MRAQHSVHHGILIILACASGAMQNRVQADDRGATDLRPTTLISSDAEHSGPWRNQAVTSASPSRPPTALRGVFGAGSMDCNANGIPDECDIDCGPPWGPCNVPGCGQSDDCNTNGIPDECELYGLDFPYVWDDGTAEYGLRSCGNHLAWFNQFNVGADAGLIDAIDITWVNCPANVPVTVYLWSDPDGDGHPADAQVLTSVETVSVPNPGGLTRIDIPDTYVGGTGSSFFVGTIFTYTTPDDYPAPLDATSPSHLGRSWLVASEGVMDPNDLTAGACEVSLLENGIPFPANWLVRAVGRAPVGDCNLNGVPDGCDITDGTSPDVNGNGVPDECEDCNENGVPDDLDIAGGTSEDCNQDLIPDECQLEGNDCNTDQVPDDCQLVDNDCNENGVPDECDIYSGTSLDLNVNDVPDECEDCNQNGLPDEWDIEDQTSMDCQPDGVPDECQWGVPQYVSYALDDGTLEATLGLGQPGEIAWLNHFTVQAGMEEITYVDIVYTDIPEGLPITIYLWSDPNGDGNPADAQVLASMESTVTDPGQGIFSPVYFGDTYVGEAGTSFFVGAILRDETGFLYPISRDTTNPQGESWLVGALLPDEIDPGNLGAAQYFGRLEDFGFAANCLIRARAFSGIYPNDCNDNTVPDECDLADGTLEDLDGNGIADVCEDCNGNGLPDACDLTCEGPCDISGCGQSADCDANNLPDECDVAAGADCNDNGVPDACDVSGGTSPDCNEDGTPDECQLVDNDCNFDNIPDECQLGGPALPQYTLDDGTLENFLGLTSGGYIAWLNHFVTEFNGESIKGIRIAYGNTAPGAAVTVYLWSDPNGDGNPNDAQVLASAATTVQYPASNIFTYVAIPETFVGSPGTSFFVGALMQHSTGQLPAPLDASTNAGESWLAADSAALTAENLGAADIFGLTGSFGFPGNWMVRAVAAGQAPPNDCNGNGIPDECDLPLPDPSDCCFVHATPGCDDPECQDVVCAADPVCCNVEWDDVCVQRAQDQCGDLCIGGGDSLDCNENGVPDECDVPPIGDTSLDCNANIVPDECEVAEGKDCDGNNIPDDCQPEDDCDDNGLLDICELDYENGLIGQYWASYGGDGNFSDRVAVHVDPNINFNWGGAQPYPDVPADDFTVRWTGLLLTPPVSGQYVFATKADDGVRLWINNQLLIDEWHSSSNIEYAASVALLGDTYYHLRLEYYDGGGDARVYLKWAPPTMPLDILPTEALYASQDCNGNDVPDACDIESGPSDDVNGNGVPDECEDCNGNGVLDDVDVSNGSSEDCNGNGLPDECEGGLSDCDGNSVPDDCEIEDNDCDGNGVFDACQVIISGLIGEYYNNAYYSGTPLVRIDSQIDFDWMDQAPFPAPFPTDDFTIRWTGALLTEAAGVYHFRADRDDGFRLYLNGQLVFDDSGGDSIELDGQTLYHIRGEYWEDSGGARVTLLWTPPGESEIVIPTANLFPMLDANANDLPDVCELGDCNGNGLPDPMDIELGLSLDCDGNGTPDDCQGECDCDGNGILESCEVGNGLVGQYWASYGGDGIFSQRLFVRIDPVIDFNDSNWGPGVPDNNFAVRWTGSVTTTSSAGTYTFYTRTDDGVRLWVDDQLLIDKWINQSPTEWSAMIDLEADTTYLIRMDYYESGGGAEARLSWQPPGGVKEIIPSAMLGPMADADGDGLPDACLMRDCNANGIADTEDISACDGSAWCSDCNDNCVPDECDLVLPPPDYGVAHWRFEEGGGTAILDSGPNGLDGTTNGQPAWAGDVPVDPVPQNQLPNTWSLDLNWQSTSSGGFFNVPDTGGLLTMGDQDFTIEAWVRLDDLSDTSSNDERQFLCQKKALPSQDTNLDYAVLVQRGNNSPGTTYGKTGSFTGRELQVYFGTGSGNWNVTSYLQINDNDWHLVSFAYDAVNNNVRFGLDNQFETIQFNQSARVTNNGPLRVGSHQNGQGVNNFFLRGAIDELRISDRIVPELELLNAAKSSYSEDVNSNGVPDECEGEACPTDVNGDGTVNASDLAQLLGSWGPNPGHPADFNDDGLVNATDLAQLLGTWGPCGP